MSKAYAGSDTSRFKASIAPEAEVQIEGRADPRRPDRLEGSRTETRESRDGQLTGTVTWSHRCQ